MSSSKKIWNEFKKLSLDRQEHLFVDIYNFSQDMKLFLENRFSGGQKGAAFVKQMQKATIDKIYRKGIPGTIDGRQVNAIISKAKKSCVDFWTLMELEKLAYRGFTEFLNEFGGGPDSYENMSWKHLEQYLTLAKTNIQDKSEQIKIFEEVRSYLLTKSNMFTDYLDETFTEVTGIEIERKF